MTDPQQPEPWARPSAPPATPYDQPPSDPFTVPVQPVYGPPAGWADPTAAQPPAPFAPPDVFAPPAPFTPPAPFVSPDATLVPPYAIGASPVPGPSYPPAYAQPAPGYGGYGGYGTPPPYNPYAMPVAKTNGLAIASLVVSIIGATLAFCYGVGLVPGAIGAILGHVARRQIRARKENGGGMALSGIIVGWIAFAVGLVVAAVIVIAIVVAVNSANNSPEFSY